nr:hypothetical protein [Tanacetum cinerariifolium]
MESIFETASTSVAPLPTFAPTLTSFTIATTTTTRQQAPLPLTTASSTLIQDLPNFGFLFGFDIRLKTLEVNFSEFRQMNPFAEAISAISRIVHRYMDQQMNKAVKVAVQIQSDHLCDATQRENDEFLKTIDENIKKIIKEQVKEQVQVQVSKILPKIEQTVNEQLEAEVLTRSSHSSRTSYVVAADISEMELKKILIEKMEGNKSIQRSDEQRNLYRALVEAYESNKIILNTYEETASESAIAEEPMQTTFQMDDPTHPEFDTGVDDQPIVQSSQHPEWFPQQQKPPTSDSDWNKTVDTLTLELLIGPTYELMKGSCKSLVELEYHLEEVYKATTDQLDWVNPKGQRYPHNMLKPLLLIPNNRGLHVISFEHFINNDLEYLRGGASSRMYTTSVTKTKAADYEHIKDDDKLYKFKEDDFKRLRIQDIEDMLLLLVQGKLKNVLLLMSLFECLQEASSSRGMWKTFNWVAYSNPRGFVYQNKDKRNRLMRIDELHKFNDRTLTDVRTALDDRLKGIRMQYLPMSIWRKSDKDRAAAMIQAIDKMLKTRRIMRSLERFIGGRPYEGDLMMLQRTI